MYVHLSIRTAGCGLFLLCCTYMPLDHFPPFTAKVLKEIGKYIFFCRYQPPASTVLVTPLLSCRLGTGARIWQIAPLEGISCKLARNAASI